MISIREGVFETNSSSMHSIAVRKNHDVDKEKILKSILYGIDGEKFRFGYIQEDLEFERTPFRVLTTFLEKAQYAIASVTTCSNDDIITRDTPLKDYPAIVQEVMEIVNKYLSGGGP